MSDLRSSDLGYPAQSHPLTLNCTSRHDSTFDEVVIKRSCLGMLEQTELLGLVMEHLQSQRARAVECPKNHGTT